MTPREERALEFMRRAHAGQIRKHGAPYATHPEAVHAILEREYPGEVSEFARVVALLHDVLEDCPDSAAALEREFGPEVAQAVQRLSRDKRRQTFAAYAAALREAPRELRLVKAADRLHNLREARQVTDRAWTERYAREALADVLPLVDDLWFRSELEREAGTLLMPSAND